jgi:hypothetical protein
MPRKSNSTKVLNEQAGIEKVVSFKTNKIRKKFREPLKLTNKASTVRDRKNSLIKQKIASLLDFRNIDVLLYLILVKSTGRIQWSKCNAVSTLTKLEEVECQN